MAELTFELGQAIQKQIEAHHERQNLTLERELSVTLFINKVWASLSEDQKSEFRERFLSQVCENLRFHSREIMELAFKDCEDAVRKDLNTRLQAMMKLVLDGDEELQKEMTSTAKKKVRESLSRLERGY